ncbi:MAG: hypothetical protein HYV02_08525 [Deltaproteobacteria bacterium]|nr:hypothetical protein [Deltaproteobacteria bacterium]
MLECIVTPNAPAAVGPYSQAVRVHPWLFCSGQIAIDQTTNDVRLFDGDVAQQTALALKNLVAVLKAGGASVTDVVKTTVYLVDMADFAAVNVVYAQVFGPHRPARACIAAASLPKGVRVEIDAVAVITGSES